MHDVTAHCLVQREANYIKILMMIGYNEQLALNWIENYYATN